MIGAPLYSEARVSSVIETVRLVDVLEATVSTGAAICTGTS